MIYRVTSKSDIYSLGCVMYKLMMGKVPLDISKQQELLTGKMIIKGEYEKVPSKNEGGIYSSELITLLSMLVGLVLLYNYLEF
jgi:serine/threonine protein kinase